MPPGPFDIVAEYLIRRRHTGLAQLSGHADQDARLAMRARREVDGVGLTVIVTVAAADVDCPSETVYWNESTPWKLAFGA